ncbi:hypothetical protein GQ53DRAFT_825848 [Thozetella sp. PMI_491]|nr:hypothetical protein GQ53DRAFT_825848 [Thozetella sp. PMI_491]
MSTLKGWPGYKDSNGTLLEGVYSVSHNEEGIAHAVQYHQFEEGRVRKTARAAADQRTGTIAGRGNSLGCDDISISKDDTDKATAALENKCTTPQHYTTFAVSGSVVAFYCEWDKAAQCTTASAVWAWGAITGYCNYYRAGSVSDKTSGRTWSYGYTDWTVHDFCNMDRE